MVSRKAGASMASTFVLLFSSSMFLLHLDCALNFAQACTNNLRSMVLSTILDLVDTELPRHPPYAWHTFWAMVRDTMLLRIIAIRSILLSSDKSCCTFPEIRVVQQGNQRHLRILLEGENLGDHMFHVQQRRSAGTQAPEKHTTPQIKCGEKVCQSLTQWWRMFRPQ